MNLTLKQLQILHSVVMAGSISQATRSVGLSQPTLSQHLAKFEEELGTQLFVRGRSPAIQLTPAGEFWLRVATDVMGELSSAQAQHRVLFDEKNLTLRFGTTPSLRQHFVSISARAALEIEQISHFEYVRATTSDEVVEMLNTHRLNCGAVSAASVRGSSTSLHVEPLWRDRIVWIVPADTPIEATTRILAGDSKKPEVGALARYVQFTAALEWTGWSEDWYRTRLPFAAPFFGSMTHHDAVEIVAGGLASCHAPMSLLHNLTPQLRERIKFFDLGEYARDVVLVMPKHLRSLTPFKQFSDRVRKEMQSMVAQAEAELLAHSHVAQ